MFPNTLLALTKQREVDTKTPVGRLCSRHGLKEQIDWSALVQARQQRGYMGEATRLGRNRKRSNQAVECSQNGDDGRDRIRGWVHANDGISAAVEDAVKGGEQNPADVVRGMVWLQTDAKNAALSHSIPATRNRTDLRRSQHQVLVTHQFRNCRRHFRRDAPLESFQFLPS